jgi:superfamily I DNA and/or RNA helicase
MPGNYEHCQHTLRTLNCEARELHAWMDEPWARLGPDHRFLRHDPMDPPAWAVEEYGLDKARCIMEDHVKLDDFSFLKDLRALEVNELIEAERESMRNAVRVRVRGVKGISLLLECDHHWFREGDSVGYVKDSRIIPLGYILISDRYLSVVCSGCFCFEAGDYFDLCIDNSSSYLLQIAVIDLVRSGAPSLEKYSVIRKVFGRDLTQLNLREDIGDASMLNGRFRLDDSQLDVVESVLGLQDGEVLTVVGPPGSGKTEVIAKVAFELSQRGERVLITSHTNRAVDNVMVKLPVESALRLGRPERLLSEVIPYTIAEKARSAVRDDLERVSRRIEEIRLILESMSSYGGELAAKDNDGLRSDLVSLLMERSMLIADARREQLKLARIVGSTILYASSLPREEKFDTVLIDESSQVPLILAMVGMFKARKWVLIGDHNQLLPIFHTTRSKELQSRLSAFCYFKGRYEPYVRWLDWHYRCNPGIIEFSNKQFYNGRIRINPSCDKVKLEISGVDPESYLSPLKPAVFIGVPGSEMRDGGSQFNVGEIDAVVKVLMDLGAAGVKPSSIGVITPWKAQRRVVKEKLGRSRVEVSTVDSFQGREKDVIVFGTTSTRNLSFVEDLNRVNVAFTRARRKLIVLGNMDSIIGSSSILKKYLEYVSDRDSAYRFGDNTICKVAPESILQLKH